MRLRVRQALPTRSFAGESELLVATLGFEQRARFFSEMYAPRAKRRVACGFCYGQVLAYSENRSYFEREGFEIFQIADEEHGDLVERLLVESVGKDEGVLIDISSMSRPRIAAWVQALARRGASDAVSATFVYSLANFGGPPRREVPNVYVGPVLPAFAGWTMHPERIVSAVVGLGYEQDRALGAIEFLEADEVWALVPQSELHEYEPAVAAANELLLRSVPRSRQLCYRVEDAADCFVLLESLVAALEGDRSPVLLPFGPKIFSLCCLLVGAVHRNLPVWRVSGGHLELEVDRIASGSGVALGVDFFP